ncbi:hypothetical protein NLI96_g7723 [Meripilus lineatus]|uniref:Uncharacterized protein n=1 Tax=Meripilus lineatus TaxID=2056292 RepID=A0AAD5UYL6_9APHY|nr:hypothetical protein NLI96_g7723 [Physisporinus lineatus]
MPRFTGQDEPNLSVHPVPSSPYPRPEQASLRGTFNARRSVRLAKGKQGVGSPAGKGVSPMKLARSPTPLPPVGAHRPRGSAQTGPTTVSRARASRLRPIVRSPSPDPVPGSSSNHIDIDVDNDSDVEIIDVSPPAPMASDPRNSTPRASTRQKNPYRIPSRRGVDRNRLVSIYTSQTTGSDAIMEDASDSEPPSSSELSASDSDLGPAGGSSFVALRNKGYLKPLEPPNPFDFESFSNAIDSDVRPARMSRTAQLTDERAEQQMKKHLRYEEAREVRTQDKRLQSAAEPTKQQEDAMEDAQVAHDERYMALETEVKRNNVCKILQLWERFNNKVASRDRAMEQLEMAGASSSSIEECTEMVEKMDASITRLLSKVEYSIDGARRQCTEFRKTQLYTSNMCQELRRGRHQDVAERIAQLQAEQDNMLVGLQSGLKDVSTLFHNESKRLGRRTKREEIDHLRLAIKRMRRAMEAEVPATFTTYESKWATLRNVETPLERPLTFSDIPWPVFGEINSTADLTVSAVERFLTHRIRPLRDGSLDATIRSDILCYSDNAFKTSVLDRVASSEDNREWNNIKEGGEQVLKILTGLAFKS